MFALSIVLPIAIMSTAGSSGFKVAAVVVGALAAISGYVFAVRPLKEKRDMQRLESEAKQLYQLRQKQSGQQSAEASSQNTRTNC